MLLLNSEDEDAAVMAAHRWRTVWNKQAAIDGCRHADSQSAKICGNLYRRCIEVLRSAIFIVTGNCHTVHFVVAAAVVLVFVAASIFVPAAVVAVVMAVVDVVEI